MLNQLFNAKPYSTFDPSAYLLHFHGPKPHEYAAYLNTGQCEFKGLCEKAFAMWVADLGCGLGWLGLGWLVGVWGSGCVGGGVEGLVCATSFSQGVGVGLTGCMLPCQWHSSSSN